jgi:hypothetical protein
MPDISAHKRLNGIIDIEIMNGKIRNLYLLDFQTAKIHDAKNRTANIS